MASLPLPRACVTFPICVSADGVPQSMRDTANGLNDVHHQFMVDEIVNCKGGAYRGAVYRVGHEHDLGPPRSQGQFPWHSSNDYGAFKTAYRRVVNLIRATDPEAIIDYSMSVFIREEAEIAYPGDDLVDIIGIDRYDSRDWATQNLPLMEFCRDFAISKGKPMCVPEWGQYTFADNTVFQQGMYDFFAGLPASGPGSLFYHVYFNGDASERSYQIVDPEDITAPSLYPLAAQRYLDLYGKDAVFSAGTAAENAVHRAGMWPVFSYADLKFRNLEEWAGRNFTHFQANGSSVSWNATRGSIAGLFGNNEIPGFPGTASWSRFNRTTDYPLPTGTGVAEPPVEPPVSALFVGNKNVPAVYLGSNLVTQSFIGDQPTVAEGSLPADPNTLGANEV